LWARRRSPAPSIDRPRLAPGVRIEDVTFDSPALGRAMSYRALLPKNPADAPVVYLLHGGGGTFRDWSNYSDVAQLGRGLVLIAPQGDYSYFTDAAAHPQDRYETYVVEDLLADVQGRWPVRADRGGRAIAGVSMGGFGALKLALRHPHRWAFAGALSPAIDVARRAFSWRRYGQSRALEAIFGPAGSETRRQNDPFVLARAADPAALPYLHFSCGQQEGLLAPNQELAALLAHRGIAHQFDAVPGGHTWAQWAANLPALFASLRRHLGS
jgi:S-formylglutathione hydrolase FrmB